MRTGVMSSTCLAAVLLAGPAPASAQNMAGTVWSASGAPLRSAEVSMLDAINAEVLGSAITDYDGNYDSGPIPSGDYRVRFADQFSVGRLGSAAVEFCSAAVVTVLPVETTTVDHAMRTAARVAARPPRDDGLADLRTDTVTGPQYANLIAFYLSRRFGPRGLTVYREAQIGKSIIGKDRCVDVFCGVG